MTARNRRLPRALAWPVTTSDIAEALGPRLAEVKDLRFLFGRSSGPYVLAVEWVAPEPLNHGRGIHPGSVGLRIDVQPVNAGDRAATRAALRAHALPELRDWITQALSADEIWQQTPHTRYWRFANGQLTGSSTVGPLTS